MRERPITLTPESIQRIRAGERTIDVLPVNPAPKRLDDAFDGTWGWPGTNGRAHDDLTMAHQIRQAATLETGDHLRVYQARGKSHLTITTLMLELIEIRPQLLPWLDDADARAMGHTSDKAAGPLFATTPLDLLQREWCERHPDRPWNDTWVWRLEFRTVTP